MEKKTFLNELENKLIVLSRFPKINDLYKELETSLREYNIKDYYFHFPESNRLECTFFDDKLIHWLIIDSKSIKHNVYPIKNINSIHFSIINDQQTLGYVKAPENDELNLIISFLGQEQNTIVIKTERKEFANLNRIKHNLSKEI